MDLADDKIEDNGGKVNLAPETPEPEVETPAPLEEDPEKEALWWLLSEVDSSLADEYDWLDCCGNKIDFFGVCKWIMVW